MSTLMRSIAAGGASTPTQTAWVLEFLCQMGVQHTNTVPKGVNYLLETRDESESWRDDSVVGTGHPGILYRNARRIRRPFR